MERQILVYIVNQNNPTRLKSIPNLLKFESDVTRRVKAVVNKQVDFVEASNSAPEDTGGWVESTRFHLSRKSLGQLIQFAQAGSGMWQVDAPKLAAAVCFERL